MARETDTAMADRRSRAEATKIVEAQLSYGAIIENRKVLSECRRAADLLPVEKDAFNGPLMIQWFGTSAAWLGEKDLACEQLSKAVQVPGLLGYGWLKLMPFCDPLRGDPRFEEIVSSLAPKN